MSDKPDIVLFDIDGTMADVTDRVHHLHGTEQDWDAFFDAMDADIPIQSVVNLYKKLWDHTDYDLILLTGRPESYRQKTLEWCEKHGIPVKELLMRGNNDSRHDDIIKEDFLKMFQKEGRNVAFVVEDRNSVVAMWRRNGILCLQCAEGDF